MIDHTIGKLKRALAQEQEAGRINTLSALHVSKMRRHSIQEQWNAIQAELKPLKDAMDALPALPVESEIQWAQTLTAMENLIFLEIDTTGLDAPDEMTRIVVFNGAGKLVEDILIKPMRPISEAASKASGLRNEDLEHAFPLPLTWQRIRDALYGRYTISFSLKFDSDQLNKAAQRYDLSPILLIGDDLQNHCTQYYHREYYLSLEGLCERIGHPLPAKPHQTALDRARGQYDLLQALANAVTDVRSPRQEVPAPVEELGDTDALGDLDDRPF